MDDARIATDGGRTRCDAITRSLVSDDLISASSCAIEHVTAPDVRRRIAELVIKYVSLKMVNNFLMTKIFTDYPYSHQLMALVFRALNSRRIKFYLKGEKHQSYFVRGVESTCGNVDLGVALSPGDFRKLIFMPRSELVLSNPVVASLMFTDILGFQRRLCVFFESHRSYLETRLSERFGELREFLRTASSRDGISYIVDSYQNGFIAVDELRTLAGKPLPPPHPRDN